MELCFLCSEWVFDKDKWEVYCQIYIDDLETLPVVPDPLTIDGVLAMPGFCYDCLTNLRLPAKERMYQFKNKPKWQTYIQRHIDGLEDCKIVKCGLRTQQCLCTFYSALQLQFYLQDAHRIHTIKRQKGRKRSRHESDEGRPVPQKKRQPKVKLEKVEDQRWLLEHAFVNNAIASMESSAVSRSTNKSPSRHSTPSYSSTASICGHDESRTQTPPSSLGDEIPIDIGTCSRKPLHTAHDDFVEDGLVRKPNYISLSDTKSV